MSPAPSMDWTEQIPPDEDATLERYVQTFAAIQAPEPKMEPTA